MQGLNKKSIPSENQIREFWEWCGFQFYQPIEGGAIDVLDPEGNLYLSPTKLAVPPIDLGMLFKYAVPKLEGGIDIQLSKYPDTGWFAYLENQAMTTIAETPELALFWAIWEVIHAKRTG